MQNFMKHPPKPSVKRNPNGGLMLTYVIGGSACMKTVHQMGPSTIYPHRLDDVESLKNARYQRMYGSQNTLLNPGK